MFAIVDILGFQEKVQAGQKLRVPRITGEAGKAVSFGRVLLAEKDGAVQIGAPYIAGARVEAKLLSEGRDEKIRVFKMHRRKRYRRTQGHRQQWSEIEITKVQV